MTKAEAVVAATANTTDRLSFMVSVVGLLGGWVVARSVGCWPPPIVRLGLRSVDVGIFKMFVSHE
jgi:hypothetical protein